MESEDSVFDLIKEYRSEFSELLKSALKDGLAKVADAVSSKKHIATYHEWPLIHYKKNGLPSLSSSSYSGEKEYKRLFGPLEDDAINESEIESFGDFLAFVTSNPVLESRFTLEQWNDTSSKSFSDLDIFKKFIICFFIKNAIERYIHKYNEFEYNEVNAEEIIHEMVNFIFWDTLPIDIVVPILFVNFDFNSYSLSDGIEIRRLTEKEHLARYNIKSYNVSVHELVLSSATHALVLKGWEVKNSPSIMDFDTLNNIRAYPVELIDKFFASIRLVKNIDTGYAQVLSLSQSWIHHCKADLPHVMGTATRSYPTVFEDYYWNIDTVPLVTNDEVQKIGTIFDLLRESEENSIFLSVKRLNQCLVRDNEEDSVLDATIALEALLSDDSHQEMTHKLAMRVGALVSLDKSLGKSPQQAFKDIKKIYGYRSAIVHGSKALDKKRIIKLDDNMETTAHAIAIVYLRFVLKVLLENPKYRNASLIDSELILGRITS
uniref:HEPN domain-containing protein n=1 Tax=Hafnia alvei TaxID=569 RepID=UPI00248D8AAE|nr:HEPN domain-containing protein [Hafnia alvei]